MMSESSKKKVLGVVPVVFAVGNSGGGVVGEETLGGSNEI